MNTQDFRKLVFRFRSFDLLNRRPRSFHSTEFQCKWSGKIDDYQFSKEIPIVTFNLLAPCYKRTSSYDPQTGERLCESEFPDQWVRRSSDTLEFLKKEIFPCSPILGLQELWTESPYFQNFYNTFNNFGFDLKHCQRTGIKSDAVAIAYPKKNFELRGSKDVVLCRLGDRVALILWLYHKPTKKDLLISTTHLSFPHSITDRMLQMTQMRHLTSVLESYAKEQGVRNAMRVVMGDFNVEGGSAVCQHLKSEGYVSCFEILPPIQSHLTSLPLDDPLSTDPHSPHLAYDPEHFHLPLHYQHPSRSRGIDPLPISSTSSPSLSQSSSSVSISHSFPLPIRKDPNAVQYETPAVCFTSNPLTHCSSNNLQQPSQPSQQQSQHEDQTQHNSTLQHTASTFSPPSSSSFLPSDSISSKTRPMFISHRNHNGEEVGVDHIFVKPETHPCLRHPYAVPTNSYSHPHDGICHQQHRPSSSTSSSSSSSLNFLSSSSSSSSSSSHQQNQPSSSSHLFSSSTSSSCSSSSSSSALTNNKQEQKSNQNHNHNHDAISITSSTSSSSIPSFSPSPSLWFVSSCSLLPTLHPPCPWPSSPLSSSSSLNPYTISDHRPVAACLVLGEYKQPSHTHSSSTTSITTTSTTASASSAQEMIHSSSSSSSDLTSKENHNKEEDKPQR